MAEFCAALDELPPLNLLEDAEELAREADVVEADEVNEALEAAGVEAYDRLPCGCLTALLGRVQRVFRVRLLPSAAVVLRFSAGAALQAAESCWRRLGLPRAGVRRLPACTCATSPSPRRVCRIACAGAGKHKRAAGARAVAPAHDTTTRGMRHGGSAAHRCDHTEA